MRLGSFIVARSQLNGARLNIFIQASSLEHRIPVQEPRIPEPLTGTMTLLASHWFLPNDHRFLPEARGHAQRTIGLLETHVHLSNHESPHGKLDFHKPIDLLPRDPFEENPGLILENMDLF